jgi:hypothetical protein
MVVLALCKAAILLVTLDASFALLETFEETAGCVEIELANPQPGNNLRGAPLVQIAVRRLASRRGIERPGAYAGIAKPIVGHRLSNGLCAPMRC